MQVSGFIITDPQWKAHLRDWTDYRWPNFLLPGTGPKESKWYHLCPLITGLKSSGPRKEGSRKEGGKEGRKETVILRPLCHGPTMTVNGSGCFLCPLSKVSLVPALTPPHFRHCHHLLSP